MDFSFINQLQLQIQVKFGNDLSSQRAIQNLKTEIDVNKLGELSFTTLRRFFGNLKSTKPNNNTLDVLSRYLGFSSFTAFCNSEKHQQDWFLWKEIIRLEQNFNNNLIAKLKSNINHKNYTLMLGTLITNQIISKNFKNLKKIFLSKELFEIDFGSSVKVANIIGLTFRQLKNSELEKFYFLLNDQYCFIENFLFLFIDYTYFKGYYLRLIKNYHPSSKKNRLFKSLIINYSKFLLQEDYITLKNVVVNQNYHPILLGRYYGYQILKSKTISRKEQEKFLLIASKIDHKKHFFYEIFPALILNKQWEFIQEIEKTYYEELLIATNWNIEAAQSIFLIGFALKNVHKNQIKQAKNNLSFIRVDKLVDSYIEYIELFLILAKYSISKREHDVKNCLSLKKKYLELVKKTGFKIFNYELLESF